MLDEKGAQIRGVIVHYTGGHKEGQGMCSTAPRHVQSNAQEQVEVCLIFEERLSGHEKRFAGRRGIFAHFALHSRKVLRNAPLAGSLGHIAQRLACGDVRTKIQG